MHGFLLVVAIASRPAEACECADFDPLAERPWLTTVFDGEIVETVRVEPGACDGPFDDGVLEGAYSLVHVSKVWADDVRETVLVYNPETSCNFHLAEGERFIFDVLRTERVVMAPGGCVPPPTAAEADAHFGEGAPPRAGEDDFPPCVRAQTNDMGCRCVATGGRSGALLVVVALGLVSRRRATR